MLYRSFRGSTVSSGKYYSYSSGEWQKRCIYQPCPEIKSGLCQPWYCLGSSVGRALVGKAYSPGLNSGLWYLFLERMKKALQITAMSQKLEWFMSAMILSRYVSWKSIGTASKRARFWSWLGHSLPFYNKPKLCYSRRRGILFDEEEYFVFNSIDLEN